MLNLGKIKSLIGIIFAIFLLFFPNKVVSGKSSDQQTIHDNIHQLTCQAPPRDALTGILINPNKPIFRDSFAPVETVWIAINRNIFGYPNSELRIYVIPHGLMRWKDKEKIKSCCIDYEILHPVEDNSSIDYIYIPVWKEPKMKLSRKKRYDIIIDFPPFGKYNKGKDTVDEKGFFIPKKWICLDSISFNHTPNCGYFDSLDIRKDLHIDISPSQHEWKKNGESLPVVYVKNRNVVVKAFFSSSDNLNLRREKFLVYSKKHFGHLGNTIDTKVILSSKESNIIKNWSAEFQIERPTPNRVLSFFQEWKWYCKGLGSEESGYHIGNSRNQIYTILNEPQYPWEKKGKSKLWTDVLKFVCEKWAKDENSPQRAAYNITDHLYRDTGGIWYKSQGYTKDCCRGGFYLQDFLNKLSQGIGFVNCHDMGKALVIFSNAIGCGSSYTYCTNFGKRLNCIYPIGHEPLTGCSPPYYDNGDHAFCSIGNKVFDATFYLVKSDERTIKEMADIPWPKYKELIVLEGKPAQIRTYRFPILHRLK